MKTINETDYVSKKRKLIIEIEETGAKLAPDEREWLTLHHHFLEKGGQEVNEEIQKNQIKIVQKKIEDKV